MPDADTFSWISPSGVAISLSDLPNLGVIGDGNSGFGLPPVQFVADQIPLQNRQVVRAALYQPREVDLVLLLKNSDTPTLRAQLRNLLRAFDPTKGDGTLRVVTVDNESRDLTCRYAGGLELSDTREAMGPGWIRALATFKAHDPLWYSTAPLTATFANTGTPAPMLPILPLTLAPSAVLGSQTITNPGDLEAWPVWTVVGPMSSITLTNTSLVNPVTDSPLALTSTLALSAGETLTIDTRPGHKTVTRGDGTNEYSTLSATSALWPLLAGENAVTLSVPGSSTATVVTLSYTPAWLSF